MKNLIGLIATIMLLNWKEQQPKKHTDFKTTKIKLRECRKHERQNRKKNRRKAG